MANRSRSGGLRRVSRSRLLGYGSLAALVVGCGGTALTLDDSGGAGSAGRAPSAGAAGTAGGAPGTSGSANTAGANAAGAPQAAGAGGASAAGAPAIAGAPGCAVTGCNDGNVCTADQCINGTCSHQPISFDDGNACTSDGCNPISGVFHFPFSLDDKNLCTVDACNPKTGVVSHVSIPIDDDDSCTADACEPFTGLVAHYPLFIDDGNICTVEECDPKTGLTLQTALDCNDDNPCTVDSCDPASGCQHTGGVFFSEDFSGNAPGWDFGPGWQVGPAEPSSGQSVGNGDPVEDHSPSLDNGIAGVIIGGNTGTALQPPSYLTSPPIDLSTVRGTVTLEFWRWLNADYPPYMDSTVEVFNGASWVSIDDVPINHGIVTDSAWTQFQFDVTPFANPEFRVRWAWAVTSTGAYTMSGWNIDDVLVSGGSLNSCQ